MTDTPEIAVRLNTPNTGNGEGDPPAVADTSYLLPFGIKGGRQLLKLVHPRAALSPMSVQGELTRLSSHGDTAQRAAATALLSRGTAVRYVALDESQATPRDQILDELHQDAVSRGRATGRRNPASTANLGEAECMCLAHPSPTPMRCNDSGARRVATRRSIKTLTTADDLFALVQAGTYTANQMAQIARRMMALDIGDVVTGPAYFRRQIRNTGN